MQIKISFKHSEKSKIKYVSPATFFFSEDCSTGPVVEQGEIREWKEDLKEGDRIEFSTTKFDDEFEIKIWRGKKLLNAPSFKSKVKSKK